MFDIGLSELVVMAVVGLLILRPADIPPIIGALVKTFHAIRRWIDEARFAISHLLSDHHDQIWPGQDKPDPPAPTLSSPEQHQDDGDKKHQDDI